MSLYFKLFLWKYWFLLIILFSLTLSWFGFVFCIPCFSPLTLMLSICILVATRLANNKFFVILITLLSFSLSSSMSRGPWSSLSLLPFSLLPRILVFLYFSYFSDFVILFKRIHRNCFINFTSYIFFAPIRGGSSLAMPLSFMLFYNLTFLILCFVFNHLI